VKRDADCHKRGQEKQKTEMARAEMLKAEIRNGPEGLEAVSGHPRAII
jgi:hypothetical protein